MRLDWDSYAKGTRISRWMAMKVTALYWITDKLAQMRSAKLDSGVIRIGKKTFSVDKSQPYFFMSGGFLRRKLSPLYILKHNTPYPITMPSAESKLRYSSENITNLLEMKTLDNILQTPG
jgi:hypothetical protein